MHSPFNQFSLPPGDPTVVIRCDHLQGIYSVFSGLSRADFRRLEDAADHALNLRGSAALVVIDEWGQEIWRINPDSETDASSTCEPLSRDSGSGGIDDEAAEA